MNDYYILRNKIFLFAELTSTEMIMKKGKRKETKKKVIPTAFSAAAAASTPNRLHPSF